ncbi:nitrate reductase [Polycladidibacter hongkongensis]|uniref:nitrate reductase n=1 Tax=Polycladidibacter hongkongensis TaxID=1647556 RepID=UPI0012E3DF5F|nr:nitrate reductase [Pseudovibrio hongkongensis]
MEKTVHTTCPYCGVGCGVLANVRSDGTVEITGDPEHPANYGRLCSKGSALAQTLGTEERLLTPHIYGRKADWNDALDLVARNFSEAIDTHGPDSVAFYVSGQLLTEDYYVANKLMKGFFGSANIDTNSRLCMASAVAAHKRAFGADHVPCTYEDLEEADLIVLAGSNLAWCHPVLMRRIEAARQRKPQKLVVIDPRRTASAELADLHLPILPDGDRALFCGLLNYLATSGHLDSKFIEAHTSGFEIALAAAAQWDDEKVCQATGLTVHQLEAFYALFATHEKTVSVFSMGINQSSIGTEKAGTIINCHLATGRIGKAGAGPFSMTGQPNAMGGREVGGLANMLAAHMDLQNSAHRKLVKSFWDAPKIAKKQGLKAVELFEIVRKGKIKALWIMHTNPVVSMPAAAKVEEALQTCPFVVVSDITSNTDSARHAHVLLPASAWGEKDGTVTNSERRISRQRPFMQAPGKAMPDYWQLAQVGQRMGFGGAFDYSSPAQIFREHAALSGKKNTAEEGIARDFDISCFEEISGRDYNALKPFQWPVHKFGHDKSRSRSFADGQFFHSDKRAKFIEVAPPIGSALAARDRERKQFYLNTGRLRDQWHTMTRSGLSERLCAHLPEPFAAISPDDFKEMNLQVGDVVTLSNGLGLVQLRAFESDAQKPGEVFVPLHWSDQFASNARIDKLIKPDPDPISGQPAFKHSHVQIKRCSGAVYGFAVSRHRPRFQTVDYAAAVPCAGGWRLEFAHHRHLKKQEILHLLGLDELVSAQLKCFSYTSAQGGERFGLSNSRSLQALVFCDAQPVKVQRDYIVELFTQPLPCGSDRHLLLAGKPAGDQPVKGPIVCSCESVGRYQLEAAIKGGAVSLEELVRQTGAGSNCGSCRVELGRMLDAQHQHA